LLNEQKWDLEHIYPVAEPRIDYNEKIPDIINIVDTNNFLSIRPFSITMLSNVFLNESLKILEMAMYRIRVSKQRNNFDF
jgi:hypothetical protein